MANGVDSNQTGFGSDVGTFFIGETFTELLAAPLMHAPVQAQMARMMAIGVAMATAPRAEKMPIIILMASDKPVAISANKTFVSHYNLILMEKCR